MFHERTIPLEHTRAERFVMQHEFVQSSALPKPVGPYSPGITFDRLILVSGQGATDPSTGKLSGPDAASQTEQATSSGMGCSHGPNCPVPTWS